MWTRFSWLQIRTSGGLLWSHNERSGTMTDVLIGVAELLLCPENELCCMCLVVRSDASLIDSWTAADKNSTPNIAYWNSLNGFEDETYIHTYSLFGIHFMHFGQKMMKRVTKLKFVLVRTITVHWLIQLCAKTTKVDAMLILYSKCWDEFLISVVVPGFRNIFLIMKTSCRRRSAPACKVECDLLKPNVPM
jgi:hypothetical protein